MTASPLPASSRHPPISADPRVIMGKPVIRGTRVPMETVLRALDAGDDEATVLFDYPGLTPDDIRAAQAYAADVLANEHVEAAD